MTTIHTSCRTSKVYILWQVYINFGAIPVIKIKEIPMSLQTFFKSINPADISRSKNDGNIYILEMDA